MPKKIVNGEFKDIKEKLYLINDRTIRIEEHLKNLNGELVEVKQSEKDCKVDFNERINKNNDRITDLYVKLALIVGGGGLGGGIIGSFVSKFLGV